MNDDLYLEVKTPLVQMQTDIPPYVPRLPEAPFSSTERSLRHLRELAASLADHERAAILYCLYYDNFGFRFYHGTTYEEVLATVDACRAAGVELWQADFEVTPAGVALKRYLRTRGVVDRFSCPGALAGTDPTDDRLRRSLPKFRQALLWQAKPHRHPAGLLVARSPSAAPTVASHAGGGMVGYVAAVIRHEEDEHERAYQKEERVETEMAMILESRHLKAQLRAGRDGQRASGRRRG
ncbi:MAG: DNA/RNA nuclease SfsA [Adlercreutzia equolifaciens]